MGGLRVYVSPIGPECCPPDVSPPPVATSMREIAREIAIRRGVSVEDLRGDRRFKKIAKARQEAMYWAKARVPSRSLPMIAHVFRRDHTTVLHGIRVTADRFGLPIPVNDALHTRAD